jgi:hypothetical protein
LEHEESDNDGTDDAREDEVEDACEVCGLVIVRAVVVLAFEREIGGVLGVVHVGRMEAGVSGHCVGVIVLWYCGFVCSGDFRRI